MVQPHDFVHHSLCDAIKGRLNAKLCGNHWCNLPVHVLRSQRVFETLEQAIGHQDQEATRFVQRDSITYMWLGCDRLTSHIAEIRKKLFSFDYLPIRLNVDQSYAVLGYWQAIVHTSWYSTCILCVNLFNKSKFCKKVFILKITYILMNYQLVNNQTIPQHA